MSQTLDLTFHALADPTRRDILARLARGPSKVGDLVSPLKMTWPAVTKHLKVLEHARLVKRQRKGRSHIISLDSVALDEAQAWISIYREYWHKQFDSLERYLETTDLDPNTSKERK